MGLFDGAKSAVSGNRAYRLHVDANKLTGEGKTAQAKEKYQAALKLYDEADFEVSWLMQSYWVNFVKTGDPNGEGLPRWDAREEGSELLMEFCEEPKMTEDPYLAIYEILDKYQDEAAEKTE